MVNPGNLALSNVVAFAPTKNAERARVFYESKLGLAFQSDDSFAMVFEANGTMLRIVRVGNFTPAPYTILGWQVTDIQATVTQLRSRQIEFQRYAGMEQDANGIWRAPSGDQVAWFLDPDGNVLSISQVG